MSPKNKKNRRELRRVLQNEFTDEVQSDIDKEVEQIKELSTDKLPDDLIDFDFENDDHRPLDEGTALIY